MLLGIGSYTYGWSVAYNAINELDLNTKAKEFGVKLLQVGDNLPLHTFNEARLQKFEQALRENNITLEIGAKGLTANHLKNYIAISKRFHAGILRFIIDDADYKPGTEEVIQIIQTHIPLLEENDITLALENHDRLKAKEYAQIIEKINSKHAGICLDTVNSLGAGESIENIIDILAPHTVNLHIKDFGIARLPHKQGFIIEGRISGEGVLNVNKVLNMLKPYNLCHTCILEQWVPPEKDEQATIRKEMEWAEESMRYLKPLLTSP